jgi:hypothetical protein
LSALVGLHTLDLSCCSELSDVQPLSVLAGLDTLDLSRCRQLVDVRPLSALTSSLHKLDLTPWTPPDRRIMRIDMNEL